MNAKWTWNRASHKQSEQLRFNKSEWSSHLGEDMHERRCARDTQIQFESWVKVQTYQS